MITVQIFGIILEVEDAKKGPKVSLQMKCKFNLFLCHFLCQKKKIKIREKWNLKPNIVGKLSNVSYAL